MQLAEINHLVKCEDQVVPPHVLLPNPAFFSRRQYRFSDEDVQRLLLWKFTVFATDQPGEMEL